MSNQTNRLGKTVHDSEKSQRRSCVASGDESSGVNNEKKTVKTLPPSSPPLEGGFQTL